MVDAAGAIRPTYDACALALTPDEYATYAAGKSFAPPQSPAWVASWMAHAGADSIVVLLRDAGGASIALPLDVVRKGPLRIARLMGGSHANGNFPAFAGNTQIGSAALAAAVRSLRPDVDLLRLERLAPSLEGIANPIAALPHKSSPNISLAVNLDGGFEPLMDRISGRRKRKKHRSQTRKFEAAGGFRRLRASTIGEVDRLLEAFLQMKHQRFLRMGIADVFAPAGIRAFFRDLFVAGLDSGDFMLDGLEVAGRLRAVTGSSVCGNRLICEFGAIADDELAGTSPGDFLFFENIQEACESGFAVYDFSVGDEFYKRLWCDIETEHVDVLVPTSVRGRMAATLIEAESGLKRAIKNNPALWDFTKKLRRRTAGSETTAEADD